MIIWPLVLAFYVGGVTALPMQQRCASARLRCGPPAGRG